MGSSPFLIPPEYEILVPSSCALIIGRLVVAHLSLPVSHEFMDFVLCIYD